MFSFRLPNVSMRSNVRFFYVCVVMLVLSSFVSSIDMNTVVSPTPVFTAKDILTAAPATITQTKLVNSRGGFYIYMGTTATSYAEANRLCRSYNWRLPSMHFVTDKTALGNLHRTVFGTSGTAHQVEVYLGATDIYRTRSYQQLRESKAWIWEDGSAMDYTLAGNWATNEGTAISENCVHFERTTLTGNAIHLFDSNCAVPRYVFCQSPPSGESYPLSEDAAGGGVDLTSQASFGSAILMADLNNDGTRDLVVGSYLASGANVSSSFGIVTTYLGIGNGLFSTTARDKLKGVDYYGPERLQNKFPGFVLDKTYNNLGERFGYSLAVTKPFVANGYRNLVVGAPNRGYNRGGAVYLFEGSASGFKTWPLRVWEEDLDKRQSMFGAAVAAGDFNNDGLPDVAIGAPNDEYYRGRVEVFMGKATLQFPPSGIASWAANQHIMGPAQTNRKQAYFGRSLAVCKLGTDAYDDLVVGAPMASPSVSGVPRIHYGAVYVYKSTSTAGLPTSPTLTIVGPQIGSNFGFSVACTDLTGDGVDEIIIGAPQFGQKGEGLPNEGKVFVYNYNGVLQGEIRGLVKDAYFGYAVAGAGDVDKNGKQDVIVGAPFEVTGDKRSGAAYILLTDSTGKIPTDKSDKWRVVRVSRPGAGPAFGANVAGVDMNADGYADILVTSGAAAHNDTEREAERAAPIGTDYVFMSQIVRDMKRVGDFRHDDFDIYNDNCGCDESCSYGDIRGQGSPGDIANSGECNTIPVKEKCNVCAPYGRTAWTGEITHGGVLGLLRTYLDANGKPIYLPCPTSVPCKKSMHTKAMFDKWFTTVLPDSNNIDHKMYGANYDMKKFIKVIKIGYQGSLPLYRYWVPLNAWTQSEGAKGGYFPSDQMIASPTAQNLADGYVQGWGPETYTDPNSPLCSTGFGCAKHNYLFTTEISGKFKYQGGETFMFCGDDDVWVYINGRLAMDLGGLHPRACCTIYLDRMAEAKAGGEACAANGPLYITKGGTYSFLMLHAERYCCGSNFEMDTTMALDTQASSPSARDLSSGRPCDCTPGTSHGECLDDLSNVCTCHRQTELGYWDGEHCNHCLAGWSGANCAEEVAEHEARGPPASAVTLFSEGFENDGFGTRYDLGYRVVSGGTAFERRSVISGTATGITTSFGDYLLGKNVVLNRNDDPSVHYFRPYEWFDVSSFDSITIYLSIACSGSHTDQDRIELNVDWDWTGGAFEKTNIATWKRASGTGAIPDCSATMTQKSRVVPVPAGTKYMGLEVVLFENGDRSLGVDNVIITGTPKESRIHFMGNVVDTNIVASSYTILHQCAPDKFQLWFDVTIPASVPNDMILLRKGLEGSPESAPAVYLTTDKKIKVVMSTSATTSNSFTSKTAIVSDVSTRVQLVYMTGTAYLAINEVLDSVFNTGLYTNVGKLHVKQYPASDYAGAVAYSGAIMNVAFSCVDVTIPGRFLTSSMSAEKINVFYALPNCKESLTVTGTSQVPLTENVTISYSLTVKNNGPSADTNVVVDVDITPDHTGSNGQVYSFSPSTGVTVLASDKTKIMWSVGSVAVSQTKTLTISMVVYEYPGFSVSAITCAARLSSTSHFGPKPTGSATTALAKKANVGIAEGTQTTDTLLPGDIFMFENVLSNIGPSTAYNLVLTNAFPERWSLESYTVTSPQGVAVNCLLGVNLLNCNVPRLAKDASATVRFNMKIGAGTRGTYANHKSVLLPSPTVDDDDLSNNEILLDPITVTSSAALSIASFTANDNMIVGNPSDIGRVLTQYMEWPVQLYNAGPSDARDVLFTLDESALGLIVPDVGLLTLPTGVTCVLGSAAQPLVTCNIPTFKALETLNLVIRAPINFAGVAQTTNIAASVQMTWSDDDHASGSVSANVEFTYTPKVDLAVSVTAGTSVMMISDKTTVQVNVRSLGPIKAESASFTVYLPPDMDYNTTEAEKVGCVLDCVKPDCSGGLSPLGTAASKKMVCTCGTLAVGAQKIISFGVTSTSATDAHVSIVAQGNSTLTDSTPTNDIGKAEISVSTATDLQLVMTYTPAPAYPGAPYGYAFVAFNGGRNIAQDVKLTVDIPSFLKRNAFSTSPTGVCDSSDLHHLECTWPGELARGGVYRLFVLVKGPSYLPDKTLVLTNGTVTCSNKDGDESPYDNVASSSHEMLRKSDLSVSLVTRPPVVVGGLVVQHTIFVQNVGPSDADGAVVTDYIPGQGSYAPESSVLPPGVSCDEVTMGGRKIVCNITKTLGVLAPSSELTIVLAIRTDRSETVGTLSSNVTIWHPLIDPNYENNVRSASVELTTPYTAIQPTITFRGKTYGYVDATQTVNVQLTSEGPSKVENLVLLISYHPDILFTKPSANPANCTIPPHDGKSHPDAPFVTAVCRCGPLDTTLMNAALNENKPMQRAFDLLVPEYSLLTKLEVRVQTDGEIRVTNKDAVYTSSIDLLYESDLVVYFTAPAVYMAGVVSYDSMHYSIQVLNRRWFTDPANPAMLPSSPVTPKVTLQLDDVLELDPKKFDVKNKYTSKYCDYLPKPLHQVVCVLPKLACAASMTITVDVEVACNDSYTGGTFTTEATVESLNTRMTELHPEDNSGSLTIAADKSKVDAGVELSVDPPTLELPLYFAYYTVTIYNNRTNPDANSNARDNKIFLHIPKYFTPVRIQLEDNSMTSDFSKRPCYWSNDTRILECEMRSLVKFDDKETMDIEVEANVVLIEAEKAYDIWANVTVEPLQEDMDSTNDFATTNITVVSAIVIPPHTIVEKKIKKITQTSSDSSIVGWQFAAGLGAVLAVIAGLWKLQFFNRAKHNKLSLEQSHENEMEAEMARQETDNVDDAALATADEIEHEDGDIGNVWMKDTE